MNYSVNPKFSNKIFKSCGLFLDYHSCKIDLNLDFMKPEKNDLFYMDRIYHPKVSNPFHYQYTKRSLNNNLYAINMLNNSSECVTHLNETFQRAKEQYSSNAYIFQYEKFGMDDETIVDRFHFFKNIIDFYSDF